MLQTPPLIHVQSKFSPPPTLTFADQYSFRPSGSTIIAALIAFLQKVTNLLDTNSYVVVIALDFLGRLTRSDILVSWKRSQS